MNRQLLHTLRSSPLRKPASPLRAPPNPRRLFSSSSPPKPTSTSSPLQTILLTAVTASSLTYLFLNPPTILLDVFNPVPEPPIEDPRFGTVKEFEHAIVELKSILGPGDEGDKVSTQYEDLLGHGFSPNTYHQPRVPAVVVYAESTEDVQRVMRLATKYRMPVTPWSGGTSLEGHLTAPYGGISLDLSRMNKILEIRVEDGDLTCQSGVGWEEVNQRLADENIALFFPLDPGPGATIGGMMATGCSGTNAVRYGTAKAEWFLNATVVLPDGEVIKTRSRARKSSAGFDVTKIFIGAEGTLGVVTEATLRLAPLLPTSVAVCAFPDVESATKAAHEILNTGVPIQCVELMDTEMMRAVNQARLTDNVFTDKDALFLKLQGSPGMIAEATSIVKSIVPKHGGTDLKFAGSDEEAKEIWRARKVAHWSIMSLNPKAKSWSTDVCVPISKLPALVQETKEDLHSIGLTAAVLGHVGDGNFHTGILFENMEEYEKASGAVHRMVDRAIRMDGTCTGEHGVGVGKKEFLLSELGGGTVKLMKAIKNTIDPLGICNPGKLYPDDLPDEDVVSSWSPAEQ